MSDRGFTVLGGGLAGPLLATMLGRAGHPVHLYEMRADPRTAGAAGGRSINLALSRRGLAALEEIGIADTVREFAIPMKGRMMHPVAGDLIFQPYGTEADHVLYSVSRGRLNEVLLDAAEATKRVTITFAAKAEEVDLDRGVITLVDGATGVPREVPAGILVGADGAFSKVRSAMQRRDRFDYSQDYLEHGYKELSMPPAPGGGFAIDPESLHIWPRRSYMMIALPNQDRSFTCTLFWPFEGPNSFASIRSEAEIQAFFRSTFPDVPGLIPDLVEQFGANPVGSLVTVRCHPWRVGGDAVMIGDACHAVVPFYGQGMNAAFEDCSVLMECVRERGPDWAAVFGLYEERRKLDVDALADLAIHNFVEMRDHVGSRAFLYRKAVERTLTRLFPRWYIPLYTMVSFTRMPYSRAVARARRQDRAVGRVAGFLVMLILVLLVWSMTR